MRPGKFSDQPEPRSLSQKNAAILHHAIKQFMAAVEDHLDDDQKWQEIHWRLTDALRFSKLLMHPEDRLKHES